MKLLYPLLFILTFLINSELIAQCPPGDVELYFQKDVNEYASKYPNCTELAGNLIINISLQGPVGGDPNYKPITNMNALRNIERINGTLEISGPLAPWEGGEQPFSSLGSTFSKLEYVHELWIEDIDLGNPNDVLAGFDNLKEVDILRIIDMFKTSLPVANQPILVNDTIIVDSCSRINSFGDIVLSASMKHISLTNNDFSPEAFEALRVVTEVDDLHLETEALEFFDFDVQVNENLILKSNKALTSISGLTVGSSLERLEFWNNQLLSEGLDNLNSLTHINENLSIRDIPDITFMSNLEHINRMTVYGNDKVSDLPQLEKLTSLGSITLSGLSDLPNLNKFSNADFFGNSISLIQTGVQSLAGLAIKKDSLYAINLSQNVDLTDLSHLMGLKNLASFRLYQSTAMDNLIGLDSVRRVENNLSIGNMPLLNDLSNLQNLEYAGGLILTEMEFQEIQGIDNLIEIGYNLDIGINDRLETLDGLAGVEQIGLASSSSYFSIRNNPSLVSIEGLNKLRGAISRTLSIQENPLLDNCSIDFICSNMAFGDANFVVRDNGQDCNSEEEIEDLCGFNYLEVFLDLNGNAIQDSGEPNISFGEVKVGNQVLLYPNEKGRVGFFLQDNPGFIEYVPEANWEVTTNNARTETPDLLAVPDLIKIGIKGTDNFVDVETHMGFSSLVCNREYIVIASVKNEGTEPIDANITFTAPGKYIPEWPFPNDTTDGVIYFELGQLLPGVTISKSVKFEAPGIINVELNEILEFDYETEITDLNNVTTIDTGSYQTIFLCAYDPNDKQVFPLGEKEENFTLFEEKEFEYLIRFQNTGNYPAQDVTVDDILDPNLDPSTFEFIHASHDISQIKREGRNLSFVFKNIFLPDSINNEPESHGFIQFKIQRRENVAEGTRIENTAFIYFDFNPAIVTNTVFNTMVSEITSVKDGELINTSFVLAPNPATGSVTIKTNDRFEAAHWSMHNIQGQQIGRGKLRSQLTQIDLSKYQSGIYFVKVGTQIQKLVVR